ncbi:hypothetical protein [Flavobacterium sp. '19STA2R22 D10 B1']|uniref:hypothetical protein n=1 Tax=Flavobacterium aerium TaxID=3037261 RepID=UPI00278C8814|nr:hypothetical protein [Flavobacterium sp. '19STA2R22 D10 B1']
MLTVNYHLNVELDWVEEYAKALGGYVDHNLLKIPNEEYEGTQYFLSITPDISVVFVDCKYTESIQFQLKNNDDSFVVFYYNFLEQNFELVVDSKSQPVPVWQYSLSLIDSVLSSSYIIPKGSHHNVLYILVKKNLLKEYLRKIPKYNDLIEIAFNTEKNTIARFANVRPESLYRINELREISTTNVLFDLILKSTVYGLLGDYLEDVISKKIMIGKVSDDELSQIIMSQMRILSAINESFPSLETLASEAKMSVEKYQLLYEKITGLSPEEYYLINKKNTQK